MLADSLKGVIAQTLCRKIPKGRVAAMEILAITTGVASNIREGKTHQIASAMQTGGQFGMRLLNDALFELVRSGEVDPAEAYLKSISKIDLVKKYEQGKIRFDEARAAAELDDHSDRRTGR